MLRSLSSCCVSVEQVVDLRHCGNLLVVIVAQRFELVHQSLVLKCLRLDHCSLRLDYPTTVTVDCDDITDDVVIADPSTDSADVIADPSCPASLVHRTLQTSSVHYLYFASDQISSPRCIQISLLSSFQQLLNASFHC
ncbi:gibberellin 2-beta-dioxygenase 8-like [Dorcoceras hygrometricum]|uniref:Gibberellin 2-beta-dioxygenase 8-like n=1 Tax=Dorcoceras hygrometricum TaxID=472368 RepID=A0A2Z7ALH9_9LAMI|nr:gibberellin 2-beta-dioxygenase 8-like [Dorcoceras hygrometricum]